LIEKTPENEKNLENQNNLARRFELVIQANEKSWGHLTNVEKQCALKQSLLAYLDTLR
jgi:hypothetical protein